MQREKLNGLAANRSFSRAQRGQCLVDMTAAITLFFLFLLFPLLNLATLAFGATSIYAAARMGSMAAGRASTYTSAVNTGKQQAIAVARNFPGRANLSTADVTVSIVGTPLTTKVAPLHESSKLAAVDTKNYLYEIEVQVTGQVSPLAPLSKELFGKIPGLTVPLPITASFKEYEEHPKGLVS